MCGTQFNASKEESDTVWIGTGGSYARESSVE